MTTEQPAVRTEVPRDTYGTRHIFSCTRLREIERVNRPSVEDFRENYVRKLEPVILTGVADDWPCMKLWTPEYMRSRVGNVKVQRSVAEGMYVFSKFMYVPFEEFEKSLSTTKDLYLSVDPIFGKRGVVPKKSQLEALAPDVPFPSYCSKSEIVGEGVNLWMGPGGNKTLLHFDTGHSLLLVLRGRKRFAAFHPSQTRYLYPYSLFDVRAAWTGKVVDSMINAQEIGDEHIDRVRSAQGVIGELTRGDMLFLPAGTWHYVESEDVNIAINFFYDSGEGLDRTMSPLREHWIKSRIVKAPLKLWWRFKDLAKWALRK